ncbi:MAG: 50S ribosomal protein L35 [Sphaerobacteraceae bacterium]|nr:MAG: 50S ribosomal protein L35 [Sphaerobacteraceae bacterium]
MPKMKTHKGTKRRFKITGSGKFMRAKGMKSHNRRKKSPRTLRMFDRMLEVDKSDVKRIKAKLPYGA